MTYDEAHCAWDRFMHENQVPNGCSHPDPTDNISAAFNFPRPSQIPALPVHNTPSMPSRQRSQPPSGSQSFNASRGSPSTAGPSTATAKSPPPDGSDGEGNWWVVITGTEPGVYYGR